MNVLVLQMLNVLLEYMWLVNPLVAQANKAKAATTSKFVSDNHYFLAFVDLVW